MVMVLMSAWMPAPPPESEPAITRIRAGFAVIAALLTLPLSVRSRRKVNA